MPATLEQVAKEARSLSPEERNKLLAILIRDLEEDEESVVGEVADAWDTEIAKRVQQINSGNLKGIPADQVFARLRARPDETG